MVERTQYQDEHGQRKYVDVVDGFDFARWSEHLRMCRAREKYTTRELGKIVGCSASMISRWENQKSMPSVPDFLFLCRLFGLNWNEYFVETGTPMVTTDMFDG